MNGKPLTNLNFNRRLRQKKDCLYANLKEYKNRRERNLLSSLLKTKNLRSMVNYVQIYHSYNQLIFIYVCIKILNYSSIRN